MSKPVHPVRRSVAACCFPKCDGLGYAITLTCPADRPDASAGPYCAEHGGAARAEREALADWNYAAPESVGGAMRVAAVGARGLQTTERYVVARQLSEAQGGAWLVWLGLGSHMLPVTNAGAKPNRRGGARHRRAVEHGTSGTYSFPSREHAIEAGRLAWTAWLAARVHEIRQARGGTLDWGVPVEPAAEPIVIVLEQHDTRTAWDVAKALPRQAGPGVSIVSGLRPSGEVA